MSQIPTMVFGVDRQPHGTTLTAAPQAVHGAAAPASRQAVDLDAHLQQFRRDAAARVRGAGQGPSLLVLEAALCRSAGISAAVIEASYDERTLEAADEHRGAGLHSLFYAAIAAAGGHVRPGQFNDDTIREAFRADQMSIRGSFSTASLSSVLANVANKTLLNSFGAVQSVVGMVARERDVKDFKQTSAVRLTLNGDFAEVGPAGELKHGELTDEAFPNRLKSYGQILALTRQDIINDDLGAFLMLPAALGRKAALKRELVFFTLLLSNPSSFFHSSNGNYFEGAATNLQISSLTTAEQMFMDQVDSDGEPILIAPKTLLVPSSLKVTAQQLMTETRVNETTTANSPKPANNPHAGKWTPVATPYLNNPSITGNSATGWYLLADPTDVAAVEILYLNGRRTPTIEGGQTDFDTLGMQWRAYFDFGVAMQEGSAARVEIVPFTWHRGEVE